MSLPLSLGWHVWLSSSGNNCHAVQRSLSSGASVYECIMGFYVVPFRQPNPPTRFLLITAIGMCHFLQVLHFGMACLAGWKVNIQHSYCYNCKGLLCPDSRIRPKIQKPIRENQYFLGRNCSTTSQMLTIALTNRRSKSKVSSGNTSFHRLLESILFHTQRKDGAGTSNICSSHRKCYSHDALQKHESNG